MGAVDTTYTFTATDTITSAKMNNIIDQTTITADAIIGTTLDVASGKLKVRSAGITSNEMGANSVVTAAITDANVTTAKIADGNVTQAKLASNVVGNGPAFYAATSGNQIISVGVTDTKILLTEYLDTNNNFNNSKFTVTIAGVYCFSGTTGVQLRSGTTSTSSHAIIYKNGVRFASGSYAVNVPGDAISSVSCVINLSVGDEIELYCFNNCSGTGGVQTINLTPFNFFSGCLIRSA